MRHRVYNPKFSRHTNARKALFRELNRSLFEHGYIVTTQEKAAVIRRMSDKLVADAKRADITARRSIASYFGERNTANNLVDKWLPQLKDRNSGFSKIEVIGKRRGDNATLVKLSLAVKDELSQLDDSASKSSGLKAKVSAVAGKSKGPAEKAPDSETHAHLAAPKVLGQQVAKGTLASRPSAATVKRPQAKG